MKQTTLEQQAKVIARWKRDNGVVGRDYVPINSGSRRTESKRTLLRAIGDTTKHQKNRRAKFSVKV